MTFYHIFSGFDIQFTPKTARNARKILRKLKRKQIPCICDRIMVTSRKYTSERVYRSFPGFPFDALHIQSK